MKKSFSRIYIFTFLFLFLTNTSFALTPLPKNAYLKYNDNQKEVLILQQILNSNKDTQIASSGVGSPGKETWFFGVLTENALKKFQEKYGLEITGEINYKTWIKLNDYVTSINNPIKKTVATKIETKKATTSIPEEDQTPNKDIKKEVVEKKSELTYLESLISKYTNALSSLKPQTSSSSPDQSITYSAASPYYNPQTGQYQSSPVSTSPTSGGYSNMNAPGYYSQGLPFGNTGGYSPYGNYYGGPAPATSRLASGDGNGNGFGQVLTTVYGHERNGAHDNADNGVTSCGCSSRKGGNCEKAVSLKESLRKSIFGNGRSYCGKEIEIVYPRKNTCGVYPLLETGPAEYLTQSMDLTGTTWNELDPGGRSGKEWMRFRVLKQGEKACEGYTRVDGKNN